MRSLSKLIEESKNKKYTAGLVVFLFLGIFTVQYVYDKSYLKKWSESESRTIYLLPETALPFIQFGFRNLLADYYWVRAVQDMNLRSSDLDLYLRYFYNISALDQKFLYPYTFSIYAIPNPKKPAYLDKILPLAERGMTNIPNSWEIPYYLGFQYQLVKRSYADALKYIAIAAEKPDAPEIVINAYRGYLNRSIRDDKVDGALVKVILATSENEAIKKQVREDLFLRYFTDILNKALTEYKRSYGYFPKNLSSLILEDRVSLPSDFFDHLDVEYLKSTGKVSLSFESKAPTSH